MAKQNGNNVFNNENDFYRIIKDYIFYSQLSEKKFVKKEDGKEETEEEKTKRQAENEQLRERKKTTAESMNAVYKRIDEGGMDALRNYVDAMIKIRSQREMAKATKDALVMPKSLACFRKNRGQMDKLIPILIDLNNAFKNAIYPYNAISLDPVAALYGAEFIVSKDEKKYTGPLKSNVILSMIDELSRKDKERFGKWVFAILSFDSNSMVSEFGKDADIMADLSHLCQETKNRLKTSEIYQQALLNTLVQGEELFHLINDQRAYHKMQKEHTESAVRLKEIEKKFADGEARRVKQYEKIVEKDGIISKLNDKIGRFQALADKLDATIYKYNLQVSMNETLTAEKNRTLDALHKQLEDTLSKLQQVTGQLEVLKGQNESLEVDLSLKTNELDNLNVNMVKKEEQARKDILKKLVSGISENMYYLSMYYMELKETGELFDISMFGDTLQEIKDAFAESGIYQLGNIDELVEYNSAIHNVTDRSARNGDLVKITGYGWKIGDEIFIKVPVEKGE